jgi:hypothetical protein
VTLDDQNAHRHRTGMVVVFSPHHPVGGSRTRKAGSVPSRAGR